MNLLVIVLLSVITISRQYSVDLVENRFKKFYRATDDFQKFRNYNDDGNEARKCGYEVSLDLEHICPR